MSTSGFVFTGQSGCLLPMLIVLNLFFGKTIFNSTRLWLSLEAILVALFMIKLHTFARKINQQLRPQNRSAGKVVDVEGEVVQEKQKLR